MKTVFYMKYALTIGILELKVLVEEPFDEKSPDALGKYHILHWEGQPNNRKFVSRKDCAYSIEEAMERFSVTRNKHIKSLEARIKKLTKLEAQIKKG